MNWRLRLQLHTVAYAIAVLLGVCAVGFAGLAGYLALSELYAAPTAALLTAGGFVVVALAVLAGVRLYVRYRRQRRRQQRQQHRLDHLEQILQSNVDPVVTDWIRRNPGSALAITLLAGIVAGYSDTAQGVFKDLYNRYFGNIAPDD